MEITGYKDKHEYTNKNGVTSVVYLMDCMEFLKQVPEKYFELAVVDKINMLLLLLCQSIFVSLYQIKTI